MQGTENDEEKQQLVQPDPQSRPLHPVTPVPEDDDPEVIFAKAVAEIDTQPLRLLQRKARPPYTLTTFLQDAICLTMVLIGVFGIIWQIITYPHMLVILYTPAKPASLTTTLAIQTRTLAPITITRSATIPTTGQGYQKAKAATGTLTFYNGSYLSQTIKASTVYTGRSGVQIALLQTVTIPAANPPQFGEASVSAQAVNVGARDNIQAFDITLALSSSLTVKNLSAFTGGRDARTFHAVAAKDLSQLTSTVNATITQAFTTAFPLQPGEATTITTCHTTATPSHQVGAEAHTVTLTIVKTCAGVAYNQTQLTRAATAAFTTTRPGANYHTIGSVQTTLQRVSPLTVVISGKWAYTFTKDYQDSLAQAIQEETPNQARSLLLRTGVITYASIPNKLPPSMYINFLVLVG